MKYIDYFYGYISFCAGILAVLLFVFFTEGVAYFEWGVGGVLAINLFFGLLAYAIGIFFILLAQAFKRNMDFTKPLWHFLTWAFLAGFISILLSNLEIPSVALVNSVFEFAISVPILTALAYIIFKMVLANVKR